jgi:hypothetical protein
MSKQNYFIHKGCGLARDELAHLIRDEVEAKYREQLAAASWFGRLRLRWKIHREIRAELERLASRDALYLSAYR